MLKKFKLPILALAAALTALAPGSAFARDHWREHHPHVRVYVGPGYGYGYYGYYGYHHRGYYDAWGHWHPY
jgi:hypothetical protein